MRFLSGVVVVLAVLVSWDVSSATVSLRGRSRFRSFGVGTREYPDPYAFVRPEYSRAYPVFPNFITGVGY